MFSVEMANHDFGLQFIFKIKFDGHKRCDFVKIKISSVSRNAVIRMVEIGLIIHDDDKIAAFLRKSPAQFSAIAFGSRFLLVRHVRGFLTFVKIHNFCLHDIDDKTLTYAELGGYLTR